MGLIRKCLFAAARPYRHWNSTMAERIQHGRQVRAQRAPAKPTQRKDRPMAKPPTKAEAQVLIAIAQTDTPMGDLALNILKTGWSRIGK